MKSHFKKYLALAFAISAGFAFAATVSAQISGGAGSGIGTANFWKVLSGALVPVNSSHTIGNSSFNATFNNLTVNGCTGCGGSATSDTKWVATDSFLAASSTYTRFGLGMTSGTSTLNIRGGASTTIALSNTGENSKQHIIRLGWGSNAGNLEFFDNASGTTRFTITASGTAAFSGAILASSTLSATGQTSLGAELQVTGAADLLSTLKVVGGVKASSTLSVTGQTSLGAELAVTGAGTFLSTLKSVGGLFASSTFSVTGQTSLGAELSTTGAAKFLAGVFASTTLSVTGQTSLGAELAVTGATNLLSSLKVVGALNATSTLSVTGQTSLGAELAVTGAANFLGGITSTTGKFTSGVLASTTLSVTGQTSLGAELQVTGAASLLNQLAVTSTSTLSAGVTITGPLKIPVNQAITTEGQITITGSPTSSIVIASGGRKFSATASSTAIVYQVSGNYRQSVYVPHTLLFKRVVCVLAPATGDRVDFNFNISSDPTASTTATNLFSQTQNCTGTTGQAYTSSTIQTIPGGNYLSLVFQTASTTPFTLIQFIGEKAP